MEDYVSRVKLLIGVDDDCQDDLLKEIEQNTIDLFQAITGSLSIPDKFRFMIVEVMVKRYNRIGNEGMQQERQADLLQVFESSDFDEYLPILNEEFGLDKDHRERGAVCWR